ncbi:MAG: CRISPR system precrRNA processing endoribonuclease RAMP protein Cas6 [Candidatus Electrothrix aestuarii]|uniref:CRISPR system precrRNA processing endoribonuclease RAMP protein Cas6 n=1 Tax=Candidatus Electrothrix aestuarii TaxID=3062594 RepID=A0AAU8LRZ3_9BACT
MHDQDQGNRLHQLTVSKYLFRLRAETSLRLPPYKGSALHGAFGHALKRISPFYYEELCASGNDGAAPRPYVLLPPLDSREHYPAGHPFSCELTLFGRAEQYFPVCHAALEFLGREMGLGLNRGKFTVEGVDRACPPGKPSMANSAANSAMDSAALSCLDIVQFSPIMIRNDALRIYLPTRLRLKSDGHLLSEAPEFHLFFARLLGRINTLASLYGGGKMVEPELREQLLTLAQERIRLDEHTTDACWQDLPRFSGRQKQWMKFGGLLGSVTWQGAAEDFQPFLPYLAIGEWIHVGGKSSFGLGKYVVER